MRPTHRIVLLLAAALLISCMLCGCSTSSLPDESVAAASPAATITFSPQSSASPVPSAAPATAAPFSASSDGIVDGVIGDAFGARGTQLSGFVPTRSLPLTVSDPPAGTACLAVSMTDPDGGDWVHWLAVDIPVGDIPENASVDLAETMRQGLNDFGSIGYGGPTPPSGTHTYVFTVYALSAPAGLEDGFGLDAFEQAVGELSLGSVVFTGAYSS